MNAFFTKAADSRPTLPPLHSLNLLPISRMSRGLTGAPTTYTSSTNDFNELADAVDRRARMRHASSSSMSSSSAGSNSRTPSPTPSDTSLTSTSSTRSNVGFRLVPCSMDVADAVVLVTEPTDNSDEAKMLLLVGSAAQPYRQASTRPIAKGARVHPYKFAPHQNLSRRSSIMSISSQLN